VVACGCLVFQERSDNDNLTGDSSASNQHHTNAQDEHQHAQQIISEQDSAPLRQKVTWLLI